MAISENSPPPAAENTGAITPAQPAVQAGQQINVEKPAPGGIKIVDVAPGQKINFGFAMEQAKLVVLDVDLIMVFPDGSKIVLPSFALDLVGGQPPQVTFEHKFVPVEHLVSLVGDVKVRDDFPTTTVSSTDKAGAPPTEPTPAVVQRTVVVQQDSVHRADAESFYSSDLRASASSVATSSPSIASAPGAMSGTSNIKRAGTNNEIIATLDVTLFNDVRPTIMSLPDGGQRIAGSGGSGSSDTDSSFSSQSLGPTLTGTAKNDIISAADPEAGIGTATRQLDIKTVFTTESWTAQLATVKNLPKGFSILGATKVGQDYSVVMDPSDRNHLVLKLAYALPEDGAVPDERGFLKTFQLDISFVVDTGDGTLRTIRGTRTFGIRDVNDSGDATYVDKDTGEIVMVLWNNPPGARINAGAGDDWIEAGAGSDVIEGGAGFDTVSYDRSQSGVTVNLAAGMASGGFGRGDRLSGIEAVEGSTKNDLLIGNSGDNVLAGLAGADTLQGGGGNDTADYGKSALGVTVDLKSGSGAGGDAEGDILVGISNLTGSAKGDNLRGNAGANRLSGGAGDDTLAGREGSDTLDGGDGVNSADYSESTAAVAVDLAAKTASGGHAEGDVLIAIRNVIGSDHNDTIAGDDSANVLTGGLGDDSLDGGVGADTLIGGVGDDTYLVDNTADVIIERAGEGRDRVDSSVASYKLNADIEELRFVGSGNFSGIGNDEDNYIQGGVGNDSMVGGSGNDTFIGGAGSDAHVGGGGVDWVDYNGSTAGVGVTLSLASGTGSAGDATGDTYSGIANIRGSTYNDMITGDALANSLLGGTGNDTLEGLGGADTLDGGAGGTDWLSYNASSLGVTIDLVQSKGFNGDAQGDVFSNFEGYLGSSKADTFIDTQTAANTTIFGGDGDDTFVAGLGTDSLVGGLGSDTVDYSSYTNGTGGITVNLATGSATGTGLTHTLVTMDNVVGSARADNITGSTGANILDGGDGNDTIFGQGGNDTIYAGLGNDSIRASSGDLIDAGGGNDTVVGATSATMMGGAGDDRILLDASSLNFAATKVDGGNGNDTVVINQNPTMSFTGTQLAGVLSGVETIDFTQNGVNAQVSMSGAQINQISGASSNGSLSIMVNAGDNVSIADGASRYDVAVSGNITTYTIFADDAHTQQLAKLLLVA